LFDEVKINLENGKSFTIRTHSNSPTNKYVQSAQLNGKTLDALFFSHKDLLEGGLLDITMTDKKNN
jgi:putative alpha-1,2-mannosidase